MKVFHWIFFVLFFPIQSFAQNLNCDLLDYYLNGVEAIHFNATHEKMWANYSQAVHSSFEEFDLPTQLFGINTQSLWVGTTYRTLCQDIAGFYMLNKHVIPPDSFYEYFISKTIASLDPYTQLLTPSSANDKKIFRNEDDPSFGILVYPMGEDLKGPFQISRIMNNSQASHANLQVDDVIVKINDQDTSLLNHQEMANILEASKDISLSVTRSGEPIEIFHLSPTLFKISTIDYRWINDQGLLYVRLFSFDMESDQELETIISEMKKVYGNDLKGILLDLRGNLGGYLKSAIKITDMFIDQGIITVAFVKNYSNRVERDAKESGMLTQAPLLILINNMSASASEMVTSTLQDYGRSLTLGSRSFGKGTALSIWDMSVSLDNQKISNYQGRLIIASGVLHRPTGPSVQNQGITPDIEIEDPHFTQDLKRDAQSTEKKIHYESDFENSIEPKQATSNFVAPYSFRNQATQAILSAPQRDSHTQLEQEDIQLYTSMDDLNIVTLGQGDFRHFGFSYYYQSPIHKLHIKTDLYEPQTILLAHFKFYRDYSHWWSFQRKKKLLYETYGFLVGNELTLSLQNTDVEKYVTQEKTGYLYLELTVQKKTKDNPDLIVYTHHTIINF